MSREQDILDRNKKKATWVSSFQAIGMAKLVSLRGQAGSKLLYM